MALPKKCSTRAVVGRLQRCFRTSTRRVQGAGRDASRAVTDYIVICVPSIVVRIFVFVSRRRTVLSLLCIPLLVLYLCLVQLRAKRSSAQSEAFFFFRMQTLACPHTRLACWRSCVCVSLVPRFFCLSKSRLPCSQTQCSSVL